MKSKPHAIGQRNGLNAKITIEQAREIRHMRKKRSASLSYLSEHYWISVSTVSKICHNKIWREL